MPGAGHMSVRRKESLTGLAFIMPGLFGFLIFFALPFVKSIYYCFTRGVGKIEFCGVRNFAELFGSGPYRLSVVNTLRFNIIAVTLLMLASFFLALLLRRSFKGREIFNTSFIFPLVIPVASIVLFWRIVFHEDGALNLFLGSAGLHKISLSENGCPMLILVLLYMWKNCGYNVVLFTAGLAGIPEEYYESARIDGAGRLSCLINITLPYIMPSAFFVFIISMVNSFKVFREAYLLAGSYPDRSIYMLQHFMNNNFTNLNYQKLSTAAFIMALFVYLLVLFLLRAERKFEKNL
ncbi:MAG: sugar ABC transporter permease [Clostridiaceae bacterium]